MAKFSYRARNAKGESVLGEIDALDPMEAKRLVAQLKLIPIEIHAAVEKKSSAIQFSINQFLKRVTGQELMLFFQQLQTIYSVGVPLLRGLTMMSEQTENKYLKEIIENVAQDLSEGESISQAMQKYPKVFDPITVNMIRVGESTGQLDQMLERISQIMQVRLERQAKIKSALFYPKIVLVMISAVFGVIVYTVIPKFKEFFQRFGGDLPPLTKFIMSMSDFFVSYWYLVAAIIAGVVFGFMKFVSHPEGRLKWDAFLLRTPVFGPLLLQSDILSFCSILSLLIRSGVPILDGLKVMKGSLANTILQEDVAVMEEEVKSGRPLTSGLAKSRFPKDMKNLIGIGEESGELEKTLNRISAYYQIQVDAKINNLSKIIEPILLIIVFGMVLILALAVFMPMWKLNTLLKR